MKILTEPQINAIYRALKTIEANHKHPTEALKHPVNMMKAIERFDKISDSVEAIRTAMVNAEEVNIQLG